MKQTSTILMQIIKFLTTIILQIILIISMSIGLIYYGPFVKLKESIVIMAMNTHEQKYWATWFLSEKEISRITSKYNPVLIDAVQNMADVHIQSETPKVEVKNNDTQGEEKNVEDRTEGVTITDISKNGYKGKLMIIKDPSRIKVGVAIDIGKNGNRLSQIAKYSDAIGGVNAGGFLDDNFVQNGAKPSGIVIVDGQIKWQQKGLAKFDIIGFDKDNHLLVSNGMTISEIKKANIRSAVSFGPSLVINGKSMVKNGGNLINPRTAIGQRSDGTIIIIVIDGRQKSSIGVSFGTLANLMIENGAVNAGNLDGGSSTTMYWNGEVINSPCDILGERSIPTAFLIN